jgi:Calcineurin-like phosphoesterase
MKLLVTADLHFRLHWFRWLIEQAPYFDLVCIAGDLLDMFKSETRLEQAREITRLIRKLADLVPVAVCSGNHDNAGRLASHDRASVYEWFIDLGTHPNIITDGSTRKLENLIVTTIPYHCSRQEKSIWLDRGSTIRRQTGCRGSFSITFRLKLAWASAAKKWKRQNFSRRIGLITSSRVIIIRFPTPLAKVGTKNWESRVC